MSTTAPKVDQAETAKPSTTPEQVAIVVAVIVTLISGTAINGHVPADTSDIVPVVGAFLCGVAGYLFLRLKPSVTALTWGIQNGWLFIIAALALVFFIHLPQEVPQDAPAKQPAPIHKQH